MASKMKDFISQFSTDVARPSRFDVAFTNSHGGIDPRNLTFRCEVAQLPSRTLNTIEQKIGTYPIQKFPQQVAYNDLDLTFIVSGNMAEKQFFDGWMEEIVPSSSFNPKYKNDYTESITVTQYNLSNVPTYQVVFLEAYPHTVNQLGLDWSSEGYHKLTVTFAYTYWLVGNI
jgi:hypothetical protein